MEIPAGATPLMRQYFEFKQKHPDTLLLFQVGDFYELFFEDAENAAQYLGIALTKRGKINGEPIPLCGVPLHALEHYLLKLIKGGFRVAICDQLQEATPGSLVKRGITQVLTPGTLTDSRLLNDKASLYLTAISVIDDQVAILSTELLAGQILITVMNASDERLLEEELLRLSPQEVLLSDTKRGLTALVERLGISISQVTASEDLGTYEQWLGQQFADSHVERISNIKPAYTALYNLYSYCVNTQPSALEQLKTLAFYSTEHYMQIDAPTQRNLELVSNTQDGSTSHTLFDHVDHAVTPMGSRLIRSWVVRPLMSADRIAARQDAVAFFKDHPQQLDELKKLFKQLSDVERVVGRIALKRGQQHDYISLMRVLAALPHIKSALSSVDTSLVMQLAGQLGEYNPLFKLLASALSEDRGGPYKIKKGFDQRLDELRELVEHGSQKILALEQREQQETNISSLKIRYNQVHGYYIEVTKPNLPQVPERYQHQQTLVGKTRFTTPELKELEANLLQAEREIAHVEQEVYERVTGEVQPFIKELRLTASSLAQVDALMGLAILAYEHGYVRPELHENKDIVIHDGKHPVVAANMTGRFIPNQTELTDGQRLWLITGPNMGGKSTYLRQVALTSIMAQIGSFVAAESAQLPILDRIFTRIGAGDNLAEGKSTFLVEMEETAAICSRATENSLVILDEVGRGTSTIDGLAIAQAVVEHISNTIKARCLFATHYHELTQLAEEHEGIACYHAASRKSESGIIFLHTILPGTADGSFGLDVAELAGLPPDVVGRAQEIGAELAAGHRQAMPGAASDSALKERIGRLEAELRQARERLAMLDGLNYDELSPKRAFDLLWELK